jgi:hypothetical protein
LGDHLLTPRSERFHGESHRNPASRAARFVVLVSGFRPKLRTEQRASLLAASNGLPNKFLPVYRESVDLPKPIISQASSRAPSVNQLAVNLVKFHDNPSANLRSGSIALPSFSSTANAKMRTSAARCYFQRNPRGFPEFRDAIANPTPLPDHRGLVSKARVRDGQRKTWIKIFHFAMSAADAREEQLDSDRYARSKRKDPKTLSSRKSRKFFLNRNAFSRKPRDP